MPKLCLMRPSVSEPFSWPITMTERPRKMPSPPMMAASSAKCRSPASGVNSSISAADVVEAMRPVGMARDLRLLPRRELGVGVDEGLLRLLLQLRHLLGDGHGIVVAAVDGLELGDLAFQLGDRLLEVQIGADGGGGRSINFFAGTAMCDDREIRIIA